MSALVKNPKTWLTLVSNVCYLLVNYMYINIVNYLIIDLCHVEFLIKIFIFFRSKANPDWRVILAFFIRVQAFCYNRAHYNQLGRKTPTEYPE